MEIFEHILVAYCIITFATFYFLFGFAIGAGMAKGVFRTGAAVFIAAIFWPLFLILIILNYTTVKIDSFGK